MSATTYEPTGGSCVNPRQNQTSRACGFAIQRLCGHANVLMITGKTKVIAHLAHPADHLRTPALFNARCAERGHDAVLVPWDVEPAELMTIWQALRRTRNVIGVIVTIPHKQTTAKLCDQLEGDAKDLGVVNVVRKDSSGTMLGYLYDGFGFVAGLRSEGIEPAGKRVLVLGAGGAATAIAHSLANAGVAAIAVHNRTISRAEQLVARLHCLHPSLEIRVGTSTAGSTDLVVNATSLGMNEDDLLPMDVAALRPGMIVAEIIMKPAKTSLLRAAEARGARIHLGEPMLRAQIDLFINFLLRSDGL